MATLSSSRREFLRNALGLVVLSSTSPVVLLGKITPTITESESGQLVATYVIKVSDYPKLASVGGSVKLNTPDQWKLNPDHVENEALGEEAPKGRYPIAITRVAEGGPDAFKAVSTYCSHGRGFQVKDYSPIKGEFECPHLRSSFLADGTHIEKPNTPLVGDLRKFPAVYDEAAGTITLFQVLEVADVEDLDGVPATLYLDQNYPNPFNPATLIRYGLPMPMHVKITLHTLLGNQIDMLVDEWQEAGDYTISFSAHSIPSGVYFYRLQTESGVLTRRMTVNK